MSSVTRIVDITDGGSNPFTLSSGQTFSPVDIAYQTQGKLNSDGSNAVLIFHALSGSQHIAGQCEGIEGVDLLNEEMQTGWWDQFVGPGKAIDTDKLYVICANYFGGCYGSTGPSSINPESGKRYGGDFPRISINDIVNSQVRLLEKLKISKLHAVIGVSVGGMCALDLAVRYPELPEHVVIIGSGQKVSTLQRIHNLEQIRAIEIDPNYKFGNYYEGDPPKRGLALARMIAHKTYISLATLNRRASKEIAQVEDSDERNYQIGHSVESYMRHHGYKFTHRFDANTYLRIAEAWQNFDLLKDSGCEDFVELYKKCKHQRFLVLSIDSDVCFYPEQQAELVRALQEAGVKTKHVTVHSSKGHDAFLLEAELFAPYLSYDLKKT